MLKDTEEDKKEEEKQKEEKKKKTSFFDKVPTIWKIGGILVILIKLMAIQNSGGQMQELIIWVIVVAAIWYFIGSEKQKQVGKILTEREALQCVEDHIEWCKNKGYIDMWTKVFIGPNMGLFYHEGMPQHYQVQLTTLENDKIQNKRAIVHAAGESMKNTTIQEISTRLRGTEVIPIKYPIPSIWRQAKRQLDVGVDDILFGKNKK